MSLSLDYSLFLLTHLKQSMLAGVPMPEAVEAMLRTSGHTVLVSGATLAACFLVLGIFPVSIVRTPGIATTFSVCMSVLANLTLTPALLFRFPRFFAGERAGCCGMRKQAHSEAAAVKWDTPADGEANDGSELAPDAAADADVSVKAKDEVAEPTGVPDKLDISRIKWELMTERVRVLFCVAPVCVCLSDCLSSFIHSFVYELG